MDLETIATERLLLKKLTPELFQDLFQNYSESYVINLLGLFDKDEYLLEKRKSDGGYKSYDRSICQFILVLKNTDMTIGRAGFHNWFTTHSRAELGYVLSKVELMNQGYMTEAVSAILKYGFDKLQLTRVEACVGPQNEASLALLRKFRFSKEGYMKKHYFRDGILHDAVLFALLKEEFLNLQNI